MRKKIIFVVLILFISILYFLFPLIIQPDSIGYYQYLDIFNGINPISTWKIVRGPTLPTILFIITKIFGNTSNGILVGTYLFFLLFIITYIKIINDSITNSSKYRKILVMGITSMFILFNPVIYGYFRTLMTEFVAYPIILINCLLCYKWIRSNNFIKYLIAFSLICIFMFFLKQPYLIICLSSMFISIIISIFYHNKINIIKKISTFFLSLIFVLLSIFSWKTFLVKNGVDYENNEFNNSNLMNNYLVGGNTNLRIFHDKNNLSVDDVKKDIYLSEIDKNNIIDIINTDSDKNFEIFSVIGIRGNLKYKKVLYYNGDKISTLDAIKFCFDTILHEPIVSVDAYLSNYLATINLYTSVRDEYGGYNPDHHLVYYNHENYTAALYHMESTDNFLWMREDIVEPVKKLKTKNNAPILIKKIVRKIAFVSLDSFKILFLILPILFIYSLISAIKSIRKDNEHKKVIFSTILLGTGFMYMIFLSLTNGIIDRYAYVVYPEVVLGLSLLFLKKQTKTNQKELKSKYIKKQD